MRRVLLALVLVAGLLGVAPTDDAVAGDPEGVPPALDVEVVVDGLSIPWGLDFAPNGTMYFTTRAGGWFSLRPPYTAEPTPVAFNDSDLYVNGETGLLDLLVDPNFAQNRRIFTCQGHRQGTQAPRIQVISWRMNGDNDRVRRLRDPLIDNVTRWGQQGRHGGCRLRFDNAGNLWVGTGDGARTSNPQDLAQLGGKTLRVNPNNGAGVAGNPWINSPNANRRRVWTFGHRNIQGLATRPGTSQVWTVEHGTFRDDEINQLFKGRNYGWRPGPGYDESPPMTDTARFPNAIRARWSSGPSTIATSGAVFLQGSQWGTWNGALAVAVLKNEELKIFRFSPQGVLQGEPATPAALNGPHGRLRTPVLGPGNDLFITTADGGGDDEILRVCPVSC